MVGVVGGANPARVTEMDQMKTESRCWSDRSRLLGVGGYVTQVRFLYPPSAADQVQLLGTPTLISFFLFFPFKLCCHKCFAFSV